MDGPDYPTPASTGKTRQDELLEENKRLKELLRKNNISWIPERIKEEFAPARKETLRNSSHRPLPQLPMEIQLRILGFALRGTPIVDPLTKLLKAHTTREEQRQRKAYPIRKFKPS